MRHDASSDETNAVILGDTGLQTDVLEDLASAVNYRQWLISLVQPWLGNRCIEIGSGLGFYAQELAAQGVDMTASEADPSRLATLRRRLTEATTVRHLTVPLDVDDDYDSVVAFNVLEHIPDDGQALIDFARLCKSGGRVCLVVPAIPLLFSRFDHDIGHVRRYTKKSLAATAAAAGLQVRSLHYVNFLGMFAWLVTVKLLQGRPQEGFLLRVFDRFFVPLMRRAEARVRPPLGQSLVLIAEVP